MNDLTEFDLGWLVGIIEGEAHLRDASIDGGRGGAIRVAMTDHDVVERLADVTGIGTISRIRQRESHHQPQLLWAVKRWADLAPLLEAILPHLGERRAATARAILNNPPTYNRGTKTHCSRGHLRTPENRTPEGRCRTCVNEHRQRYPDYRRRNSVPKGQESLAMV